jgi:hypothetical protein
MRADERMKHEWPERRRKTQKGVSRFSRPFVNFVFQRPHQLIQRVQRFEGLTGETIEMMKGQNDARAS